MRLERIKKRAESQKGLRTFCLIGPPDLRQGSFTKDASSQKKQASQPSHSRELTPSAKGKFSLCKAEKAGISEAKFSYTIDKKISIIRFEID